MKLFNFRFLRRSLPATPLVVLAAFLAFPVTQLLAANEKSFASPEEAVQALVTASKAKDKETLREIFGPTVEELVNPDLVQATNAHALFVQRLTNKVEVIRETDSKVRLELGQDGWPFPIPLVKQNDHWFFDTEAGKDEILNRRIGMNELGAIEVVRSYVDAQREYAGRDHNADEVLEYAQHLRSTAGKHDGLYWPANGTEELSPLGPLVAQAHMEGYKRDAKVLTDAEVTPYHGYFFRIVTQQGVRAPGGKYNYIINGHMIAGFALVAWPAEWGNTGVMTFIVNQRGKVYQKNLGPKTTAHAAAIVSYDPDKSWTLVR